MLDLSHLNPAQHEAVLHGKGPLLIIAGAGTGKTRVLTHRIVHLIESGMANADSILSLTFNEKAATEIQERLDQLLPYGYSESCVKTFHAFSDQILRESGLALGLDTNYRLLSQTDIALFVRRHLFSFELNHFRPLGNPFRFIGALLSHFDALRDELVSTEAYLAHSENLLSEAASTEDQIEAEKHLELARAYAHFNELLIRNDVLDFASLTPLVLKLFSENPDILKRYSTQYQFVLVDEFQDTNPAQNELLLKLATPHENILVVGDDDQSIYRWRGASLSNIFLFKKRFPQAQSIVLSENYRSTQPILDMSHAVIQHNNPARLECTEGIDKRLRSNIVETIVPESYAFDHYLKEVDFVCERIMDQVETGEKSYGDFAILVRAGAHAEPFLEALRSRGIPAFYGGAQGFFTKPTVKDLLALLRALVNPYDDIALFRLLSLPVFDFSADRLFELSSKSKSTRTPLLKSLRASVDSQTLFEGLSGEGDVSQFLVLFDRLQSMALTHSPSQILGIFLKDSGYLEALESKKTQASVDAIESIAHFSQLIHEFELSHVDHRIAECLDEFENRFELGERFSLNAEIDHDSVSVLTLHAAKGLEFDSVFMVNLVQGRFPSVNRSSGFEIPEALLTKEDLTEPNHISEERRLFYVGCTRAQRHLYLTYSQNYGGRKKWKPSQFVMESKDSGPLHFEENPSLKQDSEVLMAQDDPSDPPLHFAYKRTPRSLRLSYSRINTFQTCPLQYKFQYLYRLSAPLSHAASFGSSVHNALNAFYSELKRGASPSMERLRQCYDSAWIPLGYTSSTHLKQRYAEGWQMLEQFFKRAESEGWVMPAHLEKSFTLRLAPHLMINGRIDRIDPLPDGTFEVIDYKTGRLRDEKQAEKDLQLSIYALACRDVLNIEATRFSLYYLGENRKLAAERSPEQLEKTLHELESIAQSIHQSAFEATPSPYACKYCDYRILCNQAAC